MSREALSKWHKKTIELVTSGKQQVLYIYGKAGTGESEASKYARLRLFYEETEVFDRRGQCHVCFRVRAPK